MSKINEAIHTIHYLDRMSLENKWINNIHPLAKLVVTFVYISVLISFNKCNLTGLAGMSIYIAVVFILGRISLRQSIKQLRGIIIILCIIGIANPFLDKKVLLDIGTVKITGGVISMATLIAKGVLSVLASYFLIATTSIENICYALRIIHIPKIFVTVVLLIYRYIILFLKEVERMTTAYELRAPNQKGIHIKVWGSMVGMLLLRSIDRAQTVYESMLLRGFDGEFKMKSSGESLLKSYIYCIFWIGAIIFFRLHKSDY